MKTSLRFLFALSLLTLCFYSATLVAEFTYGLPVGASVRVFTDRAEFKWTTDETWRGKVEVFNSNDPNGTVPIFTKESRNAAGDPIIAPEHVVTVFVPSELAAGDYLFRVTATDPANPNNKFSTPTPLPPFSTGAQELRNVQSAPEVNSAVISWEANVIGFGSVVYGTAALDQGPVGDNLNITDHSIELTGLSAGTTYMFRVSNKHAIDGTIWLRWRARSRPSLHLSHPSPVRCAWGTMALPMLR